jgi:hypothetical protein
MDGAGSSELRLTRLSVQAACAPEAGELDVSGLEGCVNLVEGHQQGGWLWSALIVNWCDAALSRALLDCLCLKLSATPRGLGYPESPDAEAALQAAHAALKGQAAPLLTEHGLAHEEQRRLTSLCHAIELIDEALAVLR